MLGTVLGAGNVTWSEVWGSALKMFTSSLEGKVDIKPSRQRKQCELRCRNKRRPDSLSNNKDMQAALHGWNFARGGKGVGELGVRGGRKRRDMV